MKYGIITHYDVHNHGALLQLNALIKVLNQYHIEAEALQFDKNYDFLGVGLKSKYNISVRSFGVYSRYLLEHGIKRTLFNLKKKQLLDAFKVREYLTGRYYTAYPELDAVIIGSDEVFALHTGPTPVFWGHGCPTQKVFSYAGCFGPTTLEDIKRLHCEAFVRSGLECMVGLGMRDRNSMDIVRKLVTKDPVLVVDPVILYGYAAEINSFQPVGLPAYLLVYAYDNHMNTPEEISMIKEYAGKHHLRIVSAGFYHGWADYNLNADPVALLRYFKYARCVVTDTFHGSVMSIITHRNVAVKLRGNANKLQNLLEEYKLTERIIDNVHGLDDIFGKDIDYSSVCDEVSRRRDASLDYLNRMINL